MGTRGLTCAVIDGEFKVAQYGQWDQYPSGQGVTVYEFLKSIVENGRLDGFKDKVRALKVATTEDIKAKWAECGADGSGWVSLDVSKKMAATYPQFQRGIAAGVLQLIADGAVTEVDLRQEFAQDGLFCEWCYVVDLDNDVLEVHKGFNGGSGGRFSQLESNSGDDSYGPVGEVARFKIDDLPGESQMFVEICDPPEEGED